MLEIRSGIRFDGEQFARKSFGGVLAHGGSVDERGVAAADLDHTLGLALADEGISDFGIDALEKSVVEMELGPMSVDGNGLLGKTTFFDIGKKLIPKQVDLILETKVKRSARAACVPVFTIKRLYAGNRKVEMPRRDAHAQPILHKLK